MNECTKLIVPVQPPEVVVRVAEETEDLYRRGTPRTWENVYRRQVVAVGRPMIAIPDTSVQDVLRIRDRTIGMIPHEDTVKLHQLAQLLISLQEERK